MLTIDEAIQALSSLKVVEYPYQTRKGCRGVARWVETEDYWITLSVSEKPAKAWVDALIETAFPDQP